LKRNPCKDCQGIESGIATTLTAGTAEPWTYDQQVSLVMEGADLSIKIVYQRFSTGMEGSISDLKRFEDRCITYLLSTGVSKLLPYGNVLIRGNDPRGQDMNQGSS
jgi:hypothetical protein